MSVERSTMQKVYWRLLPLTILVYFLCYLDRINVGFAALTMNKDLGLDAATYGMAFWKSSARASDRPHHGDLGAIVGRHGVLHRPVVRFSSSSETETLISLSNKCRRASKSPTSSVILTMC